MSISIADRMAVQPSNDLIATAIAVAYQIYPEDGLRPGKPQERAEDRARHIGRLARVIIDEANRTGAATPSAAADEGHPTKKH